MRYSTNGGKRMLEKIRVVTAGDIVWKRIISYIFMFNSEAPYDFFEGLGKVYGIVRLCDEDNFDFETPKPEERSPCRRAYFWEISLGSGAELVFGGSVNEAPPEEFQLKKMISKIDSDCVVLMRRNIFDRFQAVCEDLGIDIKAFHYEGILLSS